MTFTVTYRGADGAVRTEAVEAASRGECFAKMKARGITPMSAKEGTTVSRRERRGRGDEGRGNREEGIGKRNQGREGAGRQLFPITYYLFPAIVAIAAIAWWWIRSPRTAPLPKPEAPKKAVLVKEVKPAKAPAPSPKEEVSPEKLPLNMKRDHSELTREELLTKVPHWAYTVEDRKRVDPGYAKRHERFLERIERNPWKTYADNSLATLLFSDGNMSMMPPFNAAFKESFLKSLETPIVVSDDDSPELQEQKRQLIETKIWLKEQIDEGKDIIAILNEEYDHKKKIFGLRDSLRRELHQVQRTAKSVQEVEDYIAAANVMLKEAGDTKKFKFSTMVTKLRLKNEAARNGEETK